MEFTLTNTIMLVLVVMGFLSGGIGGLFFPESIRRLVLKRDSRRRRMKWLELAPYFGSDKLRIKYLKSSIYLWQLRFIGVFSFVLVAFILYVLVHSHR